MVNDLAIAAEDPQRPDVIALLGTHLAFSQEVTPAGYGHALEAEALVDPAVTLLGGRRGGALIAVGALRHLEPTHAEIKSMHTVRAERGQGIGRAMVEQLLDLARKRGYRRVSLETGRHEPFAPARALYEAVGFRECEPFGDYSDSPFSVCMTIELRDG